MRKIFLPLLLICSLATFEAALGGEGDMHTGSFTGQWCGLNARFDVTRQQAGEWVFYGKVLIEATREYDDMRIEQMEDNGLQMDRSLTGAHTGQKQSVRTYPPKTHIYSSVSYSTFA